MSTTNKRNAIERVWNFLDNEGPSVENAITTRELIEVFWPMSTVSVKDRGKIASYILEADELKAYRSRGPAIERVIYGKKRITHASLWHRAHYERKPEVLEPTPSMAQSHAASGMAQALEAIRDCAEPDYMTRALKMQKIAADALKETP